ncbi:MAG: HD domain-containing phosphohydrolase [Nitrospirota bacterium]
MIQSKSGRILLLSDSVDFINSLREILSDVGYFTSGFTSWEEALNSLKGMTFDLLIMDVEQKRTESIGFLQSALQQDPQLVSIIIVEPTAVHTLIEAMRIGVFVYVFKPFKLDILLITISRALEVHRLREARDMYFSIFDKALEGIYLLKPDGSLAAVNPALARMLGFDSPDDLISNLREISLAYVIPGRREHLMRLLKKSDVVSGFESEVFRRDGSKIWISENVHTIRDKDGKLLFYRGTIEDTTMRKKHEEELRQSEAYYRLCAERAERNTGTFLEMIDDLCGSYEKLEELFINFVRTMVNTLEEQNRWTRGHSERVAQYSEKIARELGIDEDGIKKLRLAALLHDIGKIKSPDYPFDKPSRLTEKEYEIIKIHPVYGAEIVKKVDRLNELIPSIRHHHEWMNGRGYPDGLKGDQIPFHSRIIHVADSFDAMTTDRPFRRTPGREYALLELEQFSGLQFDTEISKAAQKVLRD